MYIYVYSHYIYIYICIYKTHIMIFEMSSRSAIFSESEKRWLWDPRIGRAWQSDGTNHALTSACIDEYVSRYPWQDTSYVFVCSECKCYECVYMVVGFGSLGKVVRYVHLFPAKAMPPPSDDMHEALSTLHGHWLGSLGRNRSQATSTMNNNNA